MSSLWPRVSLLIGSVAFYIDASNSGLLSCTDSIALVIACWCRWNFNDSHGRPQKKKTQPRNRSEHTFSSHRVFIQTSSLTSILCRSLFIVSSLQKKKKQVGFDPSPSPPPKKTYQKQETGIIFPPNDSSKCSSLTSQKGSQERETSLQLRRPFANERFCNEWFCLPEPGRLVFTVKRDSPSGYTTQSAPPRDFLGTEGCICRTNSTSPSPSYNHPANCPLCWLPWQHGGGGWGFP